MNGTRTLRLLVQEQATAHKVVDDYPDILHDLNDILIEHSDVTTVRRETQGLLKNFQKVLELPKSIARLALDFEATKADESIDEEDQQKLAIIFRRRRSRSVLNLVPPQQPNTLRK